MARLPDQALSSPAVIRRHSPTDIRRLTAPDGRLPACAEADADPRTVVSNRIAYLRGTTAARVVGRPDLLDVYRPRGDETVCVEEVASHTEGLDRMCRGDVAFYFGDRDILVARMRLQLAKTPDCDARASLRFVSYEPYALIVGDPALAVPVQKAVYELFSDNVPRDLFARYFGGKTPTPLLEALFTANAIEPR